MLHHSYLILSIATLIFISINPLARQHRLFQRRIQGLSSQNAAKTCVLAGMSYRAYFEKSRRALCTKTFSQGGLKDFIASPITELIKPFKYSLTTSTFFYRLIPSNQYLTNFSMNLAELNNYRQSV
jgi:hypothetical protein